MSSEHIIAIFMNRRCYGYCVSRHIRGGQFY